jgi:hypothetical protein
MVPFASLPEFQRLSDPQPAAMPLTGLFIHDQEKFELKIGAQNQNSFGSTSKVEAK